MKSTNALPRETTRKAFETTQDNTPVEADVARAVVAAWGEMAVCESALMHMGRGATAWQAAPQVQGAMAAIIADMIAPDANVFTIGLQPYAWMVAAGETPANVMRHYLGKTLPKNVIGASCEDVCATMQKGRVNVVALHVEDAAGWNDLRAVSAAAVKNAVSAIVLVSAAVPAPAGAAVDVISDWSQGVISLRAAMRDVVSAGAIRVVAMDDMTGAALERSMMQAAGMTPQEWEDARQKSNDGAEVAANVAYQSPVESF